MAVLLDQEDVALAVQGNDDDGGRVFDDLPRGLDGGAAFEDPGGIDAEADDAAIEDAPALEEELLLHGVTPIE